MNNILNFNVLQDEEESLNEVGYDDVGGCRKQLAQIKEVCYIHCNDKVLEVTNKILNDNMITNVIFLRW